MPAKFHQVTPTVWDRTMRELSAAATVVRLYVMTCNSRVSEGLFHLPAGIIAHDTGLTDDQVQAALDDLAGRRLVLYDAAAEVVLDCTALRFAPLRHGRDDDGNVRRNRAMPNAVKLFGQVPDTPLKRTLFDLALEHAPDFAQELGAAYPSLPMHPPSMGDAWGIDGGRRDEASRGEVRGDGPDEVDDAHGQGAPACHWCGAPAAVVGRTVQVGPGDLPWCSWCDTAQEPAA